ncbi:MAG: hypothetical protein V1775_11160 [Bacteroidota bacterium]
MTISRNQELYHRLRKEYPVFTFADFNLKAVGNELVIEFRFNIGGEIQFNPRTVIKTGTLVDELVSRVEAIRPLLESIAFRIGMIELISYWKASCSPVISVLPANLTLEEVKWWKKIYFQGLGEFFYLNSIAADRDNFVEIYSKGLKSHPAQSFAAENKFIVPVGGGKDSVVTLSLLREHGETIMPMIMNPRGATIGTIRATGLTMDQVLVIDRSIDPVLLELNDKGFLNGHTPFSAMLAFYTLMCSALTGYRNIALSNESSANESTIPGTKINHQYSKSFEFEQDFRQYYEEYISSGFNYFSFLRPLSELQIAGIFSALTQYHDVFRSCNAGSRTDSWCGKCPKCMFTHIMLSAFTGIEHADRIIGKAMLDDREMQEIFDELAGYADIKPFECVGTTLEVKQALRMITDRHMGGHLPCLLGRFAEKSPGRISPPDFMAIEEPNFVPADLIEYLKLRLK